MQDTSIDMNRLRRSALRPAVPSNKLTNVVYLRFLFNDLPVLLEDVLVHQRQHMRLGLSDDTSPHFLCTGRQHVIQTRMSWMVMSVSKIAPLPPPHDTMGMFMNNFTHFKPRVKCV
jgi:hypothetical protein